ncbi:MAG: hypothetical protein KBT04_04995, partial [Bacteroidales bacterium]|nr:hypothetical protein [Candidatus Colimorpha onthohippi]
MMRKYILHFFSVLVLLLGAGSLSAQSALKGFDYQVVVRDANDYLVRNTNVKLKVVIKSVDDGIYTPHYIEHRASKTDANGYLALQVGIISPFATYDEVVYGSFDAIPWADHDSMMLDVVIDVSNQGNFAATNPQAVYTLQRLATVPYAIFANEHQHLNAVLTKGNTAGNIQIKGVDYPTDCYDVVNKCYLDSAVMEYARKMNAQRNSEYKCVNQGASLVWRGRIISTDNLGLFYYFDTLAGQGSGGTDSILSLKVRINNGTHTSVNVDQCDHYQWNGTNYDASGTYTFSYRDAED